MFYSVATQNTCKAKNLLGPSTVIHSHAKVSFENVHVAENLVKFALTATTTTSTAPATATTSAPSSSTTTTATSTHPTSATTHTAATSTASSSRSTHSAYQIPGEILIFVLEQGRKS